MDNNIIIQGRSLTTGPSGNTTFTHYFLQHLAPALPDIKFNILIPEPLPRNNKYHPNVSFTLLPYKSHGSTAFTTVIWEHLQVFDYVNTHKSAMFLSPHHSLPFEKLSVPEVAVIHDVHLWTHPDNRWPDERTLLYRLNAAGIRNADKIFTVSNFSRSEIINFFGFDQEKVIPIYEDISPYYKISHPDDQEILARYHVTDQNYFLYVGSFDERKNVSTLLKGHQIYRQKSVLPKQLLIIGSHTNRSREVASDQISPQEGIVNFERADEHDLYLLYKHASAFIYPSLYEGFGLQILEAQHVGCPMILSDIPVFHEVAGQTAIFVGPTHPSQIAQAMHTIESQEKHTQTLAAQGKKNCARYSWDKTVAIFIRQIKEYLHK